MSSLETSDSSLLLFIVLLRIHVSYLLFINSSFAYTYIHTYICICIHTHTHTYHTRTRTETRILRRLSHHRHFSCFQMATGPIQRKRASSRAFEVDSSERGFLLRQRHCGERQPGMNGNARRGKRPLPSGFISSGCSAKTFRILNSFATAVDCNATFTAKGISLDQVVNVATLDATALLVFQLLLNKPIQVPAQHA